jgi:hypothetical protein
VIWLLLAVCRFSLQYPFTSCRVLHEGTLQSSGEHGFIQTAKRFGMLLIVISVTAMISGPILRAVYFLSTVENVVAGLNENWICMNTSEVLTQNAYSTINTHFADRPLRTGRSFSSRICRFWLKQVDRIQNIHMFMIIFNASQISY